MLRGTALGVSGVLVIGSYGCSGESSEASSLELVVEAERSVLMAKPNNEGEGFGPDSEYAGVLRAGQKVTALCYYTGSDEYNADDQVFVDSEAGEGFMFILSLDGSKDQTPENIFNAPIDELNAKLKGCV